MTIYDIAIVGAGIAGASIASEIAEHCSVLMLEAEDQPGYHATGRSAAFWTESYGGPLVQPLTTTSQAFLADPPPGFSETGFLRRRGAINIAHESDSGLVNQFIEKFSGSGITLNRWDAERSRAAIPNLKADWSAVVFEPDCSDIDVAALHAAYLSDAKRKGAILQCRVSVNSIVRERDHWVIAGAGRRFLVRRIVNAAGAWADHIAQMAGVKPIGIRPMRRTMVQLQTNPPSPPDLPLVVALDGSFYFKPEAGGSYWLSPHDETVIPAGDVAAEELDVAIAIDRFEAVMDVEVTKVTRTWAGLRSFAPDRLPVYGFDPVQPDFFWFAGQGGFGIQTAPAAAKLAKSILLDAPREQMVASLNAELYSPERFY